MPRGIPNNPKSKKGPKPGTKYKKRADEKAAAKAVKASPVKQAAPAELQHGGVGFYFSTEKFSVLQQNISVLSGALTNPYANQDVVGTELLRNIETLRDLRQKTFGPTLTEAKAPTSPTPVIDPVAAAADEEEEDDEEVAAAPPPSAPKFAPPAVVAPVIPS